MAINGLENFNEGVEKPDVVNNKLLNVSFVHFTYTKNVIYKGI